MHFYHDNYLGMHFIWWIIWILLIILIFISPFGRIRSSDKQIPFNGESPLDILKKRYAKGEISREEYLEGKETIGSKE